MRTETTFLYLLVVICSTIFLGTGELRAISAVPVVVELSETQGRHTATFKVFNDSARDMPVEFVVHRMEVTENGRVIRMPSDGQLIVFPPRAFIPAGETQIVNTVWRGDQPLNTSRSYTVAVREVFVETDEGGQIQTKNVRDLIVYANVSPRNGRPDLRVVDLQTQDRASATAQRNAEAGEFLTRNVRLTIENRGTMHARFTSGTLVVSGDDWQATLTPNDLIKSHGLGLIQPGKQRRFVVSVNVPADVGRLEAQYRAAGR